jgi:hypothetical protein
VAIDPNTLPRDAETLRKIVVDLVEQLDRSVAEENKYQSLLRELLEAQRNRKSERLSKEQMALFGIPSHSITRLQELLPHNWKPLTPFQA